MKYARLYLLVQYIFSDKTTEHETPVNMLLLNGLILSL